MKYLLLHSLLLLIPTLFYGHEVDKVYYKIIEEENYIVVESDFSWALRNALITFRPSLKEANNSIEYQTALKQYVLENLILKDQNNKPLPLHFVTPIKNSESHQHGNLYQFTFQKGHISSITNTLLFNIHKHQTNIHSIKINGIWDHITTNHKTATQHIKTINLFSYLWFLIFPLILVAYFFIKSKK